MEACLRPHRLARSALDGVRSAALRAVNTCEVILNLAVDGGGSQASRAAPGNWLTQSWLT